MRFRPGCEVYSVLFSLRNAMVVLCPLLPSASGRILCMNLVLYGSLVMVAYGKPWRNVICNALDLFLLTGMLVILDMGSLFVIEVDGPSTAAICIVFSMVMFLSVLAAVTYGIGKHFLLKYRKPFRFFVCHQKNAAGSYARLLKIELQKRGPRFNTFIDCDDLNDLTKLCLKLNQKHQIDVIHIYIYALVFRVNFTPPWYGRPRPWAPAQRPTIQLFKAACLPYLPFIPALSQIPCKYHAIQDRLQRLRLHQPAFTPIHAHHRSTGRRGANHDHAQGEGGRGATLEHIYTYMCVWGALM